MSKQSIYNILAAKAEPVKVELALVDELASLVASSRAVSSEMTDSYVSARRFGQAGIKAGERHLDNLKQIDKLAQEIKSNAEQLGIDPSQVRPLKEALDFLNGNPENPTRIIIERMKSLF